jgi:hypothetical protein
MIRYFLVVALSFSLAGCQSSPPSEAPKVSPAASKSAAKDSVVSLSPGLKNAIKARVSASLKDPYSAQFGPITASQNAEGTQYRICGFVNAKNSFGGYVGMKPFQLLYNTDSNQFVHTGIGENDIIASTILETCRIMNVPGF